MAAIDKLSTEQRDLLMKTDIVSLINRTVHIMDTANRIDIASQWDRLKPVLEHITQHAREDIFESRKRIATIKTAFKGKGKVK
jgi:hypothetical protein